MKRKIVKKSDGLEIEVSPVEGKEKRLLEAFQECAEGRCSCPTEEYTKLDTLRVEQAPGKITLRLSTKKGQQFNEDEIERCLDYTEDRIERQR